MAVWTYGKLGPERCIILFDTCRVYPSTPRRSSVTGLPVAVEIIVPEPNGGKYDSAYSLQFNTRDIILEASAIGESIHIRNKLKVC